MVEDNRFFPERIFSRKLYGLRRHCDLHTMARHAAGGGAGIEEGGLPELNYEVRKAIAADLSSSPESEAVSVEMDEGLAKR